MIKRILIATAVSCVYVAGAQAQSLNSQNINSGSSSCPAAQNVKAALQQAIAQAGAKLGLGTNMWATVVAPDGHVCSVTFSSTDAIQGQWLASRIISAQKAFAAVSLSLGPTSNSGAGAGVTTGKLALSTANLYSATQPGGSLWGLATSNPVFAPGAYGDTIATINGVSNASYGGGSSPALMYSGPINTQTYGTANDPMIGQIIGGITTFGGGLGLYTSGGNKVGGLGVSGDTSCDDHLIAWNLRHNLGLDHLGSVAGVAALYNSDPTHPDNIIFDITNGVSASGYGHPTCGQTNAAAEAVAKALPGVSQ